MDKFEEEIIKSFQISIDRFLNNVRQTKCPLVVTLYDRTEKQHIIGGYSSNFSKIYSKEEIENLREEQLEISRNSLMEYAIKKKFELKETFSLALYRYNCKTEEIYESQLNELDKFEKFNKKLPNYIKPGRRQKNFINNTINKLSEINQTKYKQYYFIPYIYESDSRYITFLNLFSSISISSDKQKTFYIKIKEFLLSYAVFLTLYKQRIDAQSAIKISSSYKRLAYMIMHEENGFADSVDAFLAKLLRKYPNIREDIALKSSIDKLIFQNKNIKHFNSELTGIDPLRKVDHKIIYKSNDSNFNIIKQLETILKYIKNIENNENLTIEYSWKNTVDKKPMINISLYIFRRIMKHLIKNSIQIGSKGGIQKIIIKIKINIDRKKNILIIQVNDNCGGIEDEELIGNIGYDSFTDYLFNKYKLVSYQKGAGWLTILRYVESASGSMITKNIKTKKMKGANITINLSLRN